jgi:hypothetical protein
VLKPKCEEAQECKCGHGVVVVVLRSEEPAQSILSGYKGRFQARLVCAFKVEALRFGSKWSDGSGSRNTDMNI